MEVKDAIALVGLALLLDDIKDLGRFDRGHHWHVGAAMLLMPSWFENLL